MTAYYVKKSKKPTPKAKATMRPSRPSTRSNRVTIYVLALENHKFYVGKTTRKSVEERFREHQTGHGSAWTSRHRPIGIAAIVPDADPFDEDKVTKQWMLQHGIDNVRGGSYARLELLPVEREAIQQQLRGSTDRCFVCGEATHFAVDCGQNDQPSSCDRCGRDGHTSAQCYASTHVNGADWCLRCGRQGHELDQCFARTTNTGQELTESGPSGRDRHTPGSTQAARFDACHRCGREGHWSAQCYARTHANGPDWCLRCGRQGHAIDHCFAKSHVNGQAL